MKSLFYAAVATAFCLSSSCNTFIGMGRDLRLMGEGLENAASGKDKQEAQTVGESGVDTSVY